MANKETREVITYALVIGLLAAIAFVVANRQLLGGRSTPAMTELPPTQVLENANLGSAKRNADVGKLLCDKSRPVVHTLLGDVASPLPEEQRQQYLKIAMNLLKRALQEEPQNPKFNAWLGFCYELIPDYARARELYRTAEDLGWAEVDKHYLEIMADSDALSYEEEVRYNLLLATEMLERQKNVETLAKAAKIFLRYKAPDRAESCLVTAQSMIQTSEDRLRLERLADDIDSAREYLAR